jgi:hypothetical protein
MPFSRAEQMVVQESARLLRNINEFGDVCARAATQNDYTAVQELPPRIRAILAVRAAIMAQNIPVARLREVLGPGIVAEVVTIFNKFPAIRTAVRAMTQRVDVTYNATDGRAGAIVFDGVEDPVLATAHPALYALLIDVLTHFPDL